VQSVHVRCFGSRFMPLLKSAQSIRVCVLRILGSRRGVPRRQHTSATSTAQGPPVGMARACGTWRRRRCRSFFWISPCWSRPEPITWPVGLRYGPSFLRAVIYGGQPPINFRPFLAPEPHGKPPHWSPPVLRLAADAATPLARSRSVACTGHIL
jgi:hypothetical protein